MVKYYGYHGTHPEHVDNILEFSFKPSIGEKEWLGDGAYFFIKTKTSNAELNAMKWVRRNNKKQEFAVIGVSISVKEDRLIDMTTSEGLEIYDELKSVVLEKLKSFGKIISRKTCIDGIIINEARKVLEIDAIIADFFFQCLEEVKYKGYSRIPNCRVSSVYNIDGCIDKTSIKQII